MFLYGHFGTNGDVVEVAVTTKLILLGVVTRWSETTD
jgi:hypothetical protein